MKYAVDCTLENFEAWSGGRDTLKTLIEKDDADDVEMLIEEVFCGEEIPTDTDINDFLWFERDFIAEHLGYSSWEEYEYGKKDDDDEDDD